MSFSRNVLFSGLAAVVLMACSGDPAPQAQKAAPDEKAAEADHVWKEQVKTIDRAKEVEQTIKDADEAKRKAMKEAGGG